MITKDQAMRGAWEFWHMYMKNADGTPARCRRNGTCKTWVRQPEAFQMPVKHGLSTCFYINQFNAAEWCTAANWSVESELFRGVK